MNSQELFLKQMTLLMQCLIQQRRGSPLDPTCSSATILSTQNGTPINQPLLALPVGRLVNQPDNNFGRNNGSFIENNNNSPRILPNLRLNNQRLQNAFNERQQENKNKFPRNLLTSPQVRARERTQSRNKVYQNRGVPQRNYQPPPRIANLPPKSGPIYRPSLNIPGPIRVGSFGLPTNRQRLQNIISANANSRRYKPIPLDLSPDALKIVNHIKLNYELIPKNQTNVLDPGGQVFIPIKNGNHSSILAINIPENFTGDGPYSIHIDESHSQDHKLDTDRNYDQDKSQRTPLPPVVTTTFDSMADSNENKYTLDLDNMPQDVPQRYPILPRHGRGQGSPENLSKRRFSISDDNPETPKEKWEVEHRRRGSREKDDQRMSFRIDSRNQREKESGERRERKQRHRARERQRGASSPGIPWPRENSGSSGNFERIGPVPERRFRQESSYESRSSSSSEDWKSPEKGYFMSQSQEDESKYTPYKSPWARETSESLIDFELERPKLRRGSRRNPPRLEHCTDAITFFKGRPCQGTCAEAELSARKGFRQNFCFCHPGQYGPNCAQRIRNSGARHTRREIWAETVNNVAVGVRPNLIAVYQATSLEDCQAICLGINRFNEEVIDSCGTVVFHLDEINYIGVCEILAVKPIGPCYSFRMSASGHTTAILESTGTTAHSRSACI